MLFQVTRETLSTEESRKEQTTVERSGSQSSREYVRELREKKNHIENIERQLTEMEERLREKDVQMIAKDKQLRENGKQQQNLQRRLTILLGEKAPWVTKLSKLSIRENLVMT